MCVSRSTWRYKQSPSHSFLSDLDPLDPRCHVPPLSERRGQRNLLREALRDVSAVDGDVDQLRAADVQLPQPDGE